MPDIAEQIKEVICRPEGSCTFEYTSPIAFKRTAPSGILLQVPVGSHLFRLERTASGLLSFIHSSPGTGTRVASIDLNQLPEFEQAFLAFTWSPQETHFYCGPRVRGAALASTQGTVSSRQFRIGENGSVFQIGDDGEVMGVSVYQAGKPVLSPTAMEAWHNTARHRVIHVSPLLGLLNQQCVPPQQPIFANKLLEERALRCFDEFIDKLHKASLNLSRND